MRSVPLRNRRRRQAGETQTGRHPLSREATDPARGQRSLKVAVLGGTFNPIHRGHLLIARTAADSLALDRVLFVPCSAPPHKDDGELLDGKHRLELVRLAIRGDPRFEVSRVELDREGPSYSVDTLRQLHRERPGDQFFFIVGSDNFHDVGHWKEFAELAGLCEFLVIERPGCVLRLPPPSVPANRLHLLRYQVLRGPTLDVSSSEVRGLLHQRGDVSHWVPPEVCRHIRSRRLYQPDS